MARYVLSPRAEKSLIQISEYTVQNFGQVQKNEYLRMLREEMRKAAVSPSTGQARNEIKEGYFSVRAGKHHIYYRLGDGEIQIIDVLHQSMEPNLHL